MWTWSCEMPDVQSMFLALYERWIEERRDSSTLPKDNLFTSPKRAQNQAGARAVLNEVRDDEGDPRRGFRVSDQPGSSVFINFMKQLVETFAPRLSSLPPTDETRGDRN